MQMLLTLFIPQIDSEEFMSLENHQNSEVDMRTAIRRHIFPANSSQADMLDWVRQRHAEPLTIPTPLPIVRRRPRPPEDPLPLLFEFLPEQRRPDRMTILCQISGDQLDDYADPMMLVSDAGVEIEES